MTLGDSRTLANPTNLISGATYTFVFVQDRESENSSLYIVRAMYTSSEDLQTFIADLDEVIAP